MQKFILGIFALPMMLLAAMACKATGSEGENSNIDSSEMTTTQDTTSARVQVNTTMGTFVVELYGDTPKHRDNFLKLAQEGYYDSTMFHRVIPKFMVQAGDPDSRNALAGQRLGAGGPGYQIDAEIVYPKHFHKRGALAAARQGDQVNPLRKSSGSQFYVVTGDTLRGGQLDQMIQHMRMSAIQKEFNNLAQENREQILSLRQSRDNAALQELRDKLVKEAEARVDAQGVGMTEDQRQAYTTIGGAPHLDGDYTVFGEVVEGMDVIDRIEQVQTDSADRPKEDVRILSMKVL